MGNFGKSEASGVAAGRVVYRERGFVMAPPSADG
jgi:hypothetical protein